MKKYSAHGNVVRAILLSSLLGLVIAGGVRQISAGHPALRSATSIGFERTRIADDGQETHGKNSGGGGGKRSIA